MKKKAVLVCLSLGCVWLFLLVSGGIAKEPAEALVSVVSLDEQGNPWRQGMGILVGREGSVLTSASIMDSALWRSNFLLNLHMCYGQSEGKKSCLKSHQVSPDHHRGLACLLS